MVARRGFVLPQGKMDIEDGSRYHWVFPFGILQVKVNRERL